MHPTSSKLLAGAALLLTLSLPRLVQACQPPACFHDTGRWTEVALANPGELPRDGVLTLTGTRWGGGLAEATFPAIEVVVERGGASVSGALEGMGLTDAFLWRPAQPLAPGVLDVTITIDNDAIDAEAPDGECGPAKLERGLSVTVTDAVTPPLAPPGLQITAEVAIDSSADLDEYVCCDGGLIHEQVGSCTPELTWDEGTCAALRAHAELRGWFERSDDEPELVAGALLYRLVVDGDEADRSLTGSLAHRTAQPFCALVEVESLATGEVVATSERCYGQDLSGPLGSLMCDPTGTLAGCQGEPYRCAASGGEWDPEACQPWDGVVAEGAVDCGFGGPTTEGTTTGGTTDGETTDGEDSSDDTAATTVADDNSSSASETTIDTEEKTGCGCRAPAAPSWPVALLLAVLCGRRRRGY